MVAGTATTVITVPLAGWDLPSLLHCYRLLA